MADRYPYQGLAQPPVVAEADISLASFEGEATLEQALRFPYQGIVYPVSQETGGVIPEYLQSVVPGPVRRVLRHPFGQSVLPEFVPVPDFVDLSIPEPIRRRLRANWQDDINPLWAATCAITSDSCNRGDSDSLGVTNAELGGTSGYAWTEHNGDLDISSNRIAASLSSPPANPGYLATIPLGESNFDLQATINSGFNGYIGFCIRADSSATTFLTAELLLSTTDLAIVRYWDGASFSNIGSATVNVSTSTDYKLQVRADGSEITLWLDNSVVLTVTATQNIYETRCGLHAGLTNNKFWDDIIFCRLATTQEETIDPDKWHPLSRDPVSRKRLHWPGWNVGSLNLQEIPDDGGWLLPVTDMPQVARPRFTWGIDNALQIDPTLLGTVPAMDSWWRNVSTPTQPKRSSPEDIRLPRDPSLFPPVPDVDTWWQNISLPVRRVRRARPLLESVIEFGTVGDAPTVIGWQVKAKDSYSAGAVACDTYVPGSVADDTFGN